MRLHHHVQEQRLILRAISKKVCFFQEKPSIKGIEIYSEYKYHSKVYGCDVNVMNKKTEKSCNNIKQVLSDITHYF